MKTERVLKKKPIKAYKAFNSDLTCKGFQYEVGKTYRHDAVLKLCESGFHACDSLVDCFRFYPFDETETRVAEVLVWGEIEYEDADVKLCASNIKVVRELTWSEVLFLCNIGDSNTGYVNSGNWNSGNYNTGSWNSGHHNTGYGNSGHCNSGSRNTGYGNSGNWNSGSFNSGSFNSGNHNSGYGNSGNWNSGYHNSGDWNSGDWNSGDWNSGYLNTPAQKYSFIFNKQVEKSVLAQIKFPKFMSFTLTEWIPDSKMSQQEKNQHPEYATTGGYLKKYTYKEAFRKSFEEAKQLPDWPEQLEKLKSLPNFDAKIFEEISGITTEELGVSDEDLAAKSTVTIEVTMTDLEKKYGCKVKIVKEA